ncbi:MAG TPA: TlyA family RNA methyltransferase [Spirochaetia bacterium]|nr:TlyA family RNA methyltransferase [Spirochaetia bacterium]
MKKLTLLAAAQISFSDLSKGEVYAAIACGALFVNGERVRDPRAKVSPDAEITRESQKFVSRGGLKLELALQHWGLDVEGKVMVDAGSSTGGFTDCLLQRGARLVYAVDVGTNQLAYRLRTDSRVDVRERTSIMDIESLEPQPDAAVADLSFRSVISAASHLLGLTREEWAVLLVKPQFELKGEAASFDGVVRDSALLSRILERTFVGLWEEHAFPNAVIPSPILGRSGNREFLVLVSRTQSVELDVLRETVAALVEP